MTPRTGLRGAAVVAACAVVALTGCSENSGSYTAPTSTVQTGLAHGENQHQIGQCQKFGAFQLCAFYSPPATMEPAMGLAAADSDIHLEADLTALDGNGLGLQLGQWVPYASIAYQITAPDGTVSKGSLMPMTGNGGEHYGSNVKMGAAGTYKITYTVKSPSDNGFMVHVDKKTGVTGRFWTDPLVGSWDFKYLPRKW